MFDKLLENRNTITVIIGAFAYLFGFVFKLDIGPEAQSGAVLFVLFLSALFTKDGLGKIGDWRTSLIGAVGFLAWVVTLVFKIQVTPEAQSGFVAFIIMLIGIFSKDAYGTSPINWQTTLTGVIAFVAWLVTIIFKVTMDLQTQLAFVSVFVFVIGLLQADKNQAPAPSL